MLRNSTTWSEMVDSTWQPKVLRYFLADDPYHVFPSTSENNLWTINTSWSDVSAFGNVTNYNGDDRLTNGGIPCDKEEVSLFFFKRARSPGGPREDLGWEQIFKMRKLAGFCIGAGRIKLVVTTFQNMCAARKEFNYLMAKDCESQFRTIFTIFYVCFCINFN